MAGNREGGIKAQQTLIEKLGGPEAAKRHRQEIGRKGGSSPKTRPSGFAAMTPEQRSEAGRRGGSKSRRNKD